MNDILLKKIFLIPTCKVLRLSILLSAYIIGSLAVYSQKEKNNIYLFDCTGSMITNKLWDSAKTSLDETVKLNVTIPGTHVTIIPFGDNPYPAFSFDATDYSKEKKDIFDSFDKHIKEARYTHISDVMEEGLKYTDPKKDNRLYLLTDGKPNQGDTPEKVAETISKWCSNHKNTRLFYVALTRGALDEKVRRALESCKDAYIVEIEGNVIPQFADLSPNDIYTNLEELASPREIEFNLPGTYEVTPVSNDSLFNVQISGNKSTDGKIKVSLVPKMSIQEIRQILDKQEYEFTFKIESADKRIHIVNPEVTVHVSDEIPSKLSLADGRDEIPDKGVKWYDSFLWSAAAPDQKIIWDLKPVFENELKTSAMNLRFNVANGEDRDYEAWYNDQRINNGDIITVLPNRPAYLSIQFNHDAKTGKRYFELTPVEVTGIDLINEQPTDEYEGTSLRTAYAIGWNPLAIVLFWIGVAILLCLLLWFLFLQRIFYPRIKVSRVEFKGPGSFYQSKKIKGARKVVLTSQKKKQNPLSRLFTGEVRYIKADHFTPELEILPAAGKKKKVRVKNVSTNAVWDIYPAAIFLQYEKGTMKNRNSKEETNIEFS